MIRTAVVGLGKMGLSHLAILRTHPDIDVVAVCDTFGMMLNGLSRYTNLKTYSDYTELLEKEQLDAVLIATPSRFHGAMVKQALDKNLHVFCEKPLCLDIAEGRELVKLAKNKGVVNQVGYHYRFLTTFSESKALLAANLLSRSNAPLAHIAEDVGYQTDTAFSRAFRREYGVPPAAWRRSQSGREQAR